MAVPELTESEIDATIPCAMSKLFNTEMTVEQVRQAMAQRQAEQAAAEAAEQAKRLEQVHLTLERVGAEIERLNATVVQLQDSVRDARASQGILGRSLRICSRTVTAAALLFVAAAASVWLAGQQSGLLQWPSMAAKPSNAPQTSAQDVPPVWWDDASLAHPARSAEGRLADAASENAPVSAEPDFRWARARLGTRSLIASAERRLWGRPESEEAPSSSVAARRRLDEVPAWQVAEQTPGEWLRVFGAEQPMPAETAAVEKKLKTDQASFQLLATPEETFQWLRQLSVSPAPDESSLDPETWWHEFIQTHPGSQDWDLLKAGRDSEDLLLSVRGEPSAAGP